jgi:hypothetical protein
VRLSRRETLLLSPLLLVVTTANWTCGSNYQCTGPAIQCEDFTMASCSGVPGCIAGDACVFHQLPGSPQCSANSSEANCLGPKCAWMSGICDNICVTISDEVACHSASVSDKTWGCSWVHCHGTPVKKVCSDYSIAACPIAFGCSVEKVSGF